MKQSMLDHSESYRQFIWTLFDDMFYTTLSKLARLTDSERLARMICIERYGKECFSFHINYVPKQSIVNQNLKKYGVSEKIALRPLRVCLWDDLMSCCAYGSVNTGTEENYNRLETILIHNNPMLCSEHLIAGMELCKTSIFHEFVHYVDVCRYGITEMDKSFFEIDGASEDDLIKYYNNPYEVHAYVEQCIYSFTHFNADNSLLRPAPFTDKQMFKELHSGFKRNMNPETKKFVRKVLKQFMQNFLS